MAKNEVGLCCNIIDDLFGSLPSLVFKSIARWGRISRDTLRRKSTLRTEHIDYGLSVLIQQHLISHYCEKPTKEDGNPVVYYDINVTEAYACLRRGKLLSYVEDRLGKVARDALFMLMQLGHARVSTLEEILSRLKDKTDIQDRPNGLINGDLNASATDMLPEGNRPAGSLVTPQELHQALYTLILHGYLIRVHQRSFWPRTDYTDALETEVINEQFPDRKINGVQAKKRFHNAVVFRKRKWEEEEIDIDPYIAKAPKKAKVNGRMTNGAHAVSNDAGRIVLSLDLVLMVSNKKCAVNMRSERLAQYATKLLGEQTGRVYEALLLVAEKHLRTAKSAEQLVNIEKKNAPDHGDDTVEEDVVSTTISQVVNHVLTDESALDQFGLNLHKHKHPSKRPKLDDNAVSGPESQVDVVRTKLKAELLRHVDFLRSHPTRFLHRLSQDEYGKFAIPLHELTTHLRTVEVESLVSTRFGSVAARIIRLLNAKGKLDDKQICSLGMLRLRDARPILTDLHAHGFLESQEVPKDNYRQPTRSIYLWYYDQDRVERLLLDRSYKAMTRCFQRITVQREAARHVIQKAERTDVEGHEDEFLTAADKENLKIWKAQEEKLLCQIARMDETVALFRDF